MEPRYNNDEIVIDLKELFFVLLGKFWIIFLAGTGVALATFLISVFLIVPRYESTTKIYVLNKQNDASAFTYSDLQSGTQLTKDYMTLVTSRPVIELVIAELDLDMKYEKMVDYISVSNPSDTRILDITVEYNDPFIAKRMADAVRKASAMHITTVMDIEQVNLVEEANIPAYPSSPSITKKTVIGGFAGVFLICFIILVIYILDDTIKTPDDVERYLGISVLSSIPVQEETKKKAKLKNSKKPKEVLKPNMEKL